jgi:hypothetical protein
MPGELEAGRLRASGCTAVPSRVSRSPWMSVILTPVPLPGGQRRRHTDVQQRQGNAHDQSTPAPRLRRGVLRCPHGRPSGSSTRPSGSQLPRRTRRLPPRRCFPGDRDTARSGMEKLLRVLEIPVASMKRSWHPVLASALLAGAVTPVVAVGGAVAADGDITPAVLANRDVVLTGGNRNDVTQLLPLLDKIPAVAGVVGRPRRRPDKRTALVWVLAAGSSSGRSPGGMASVACVSAGNDATTYTKPSSDSPSASSPTATSRGFVRASKRRRPGRSGRQTTWTESSNKYYSLTEVGSLNSAGSAPSDDRRSQLVIALAAMIALCTTRPDASSCRQCCAREK